MALGRLPKGGCQRPPSRRVGVHAKSGKLLGRLRNALEASAPVDEAWNTKKAAVLSQRMAEMHGRWEEQDRTRLDKPAHDPAKPYRKVLSKGVTHLGDAIEYDFSKMDAISDDEWDDDEDFTDGHRISTGKMIPHEVRYFDTASINVRAGDGGNGCCAFLRMKYVAHGGPCGGNGGDGGAIWVQADDGMSALTPFRNKVHWKAQPGSNGGGKSMHGANGKDTTIKVPPGTIVRRKGTEDEDEAPIAELLRHGDKALVVQGGRGGRGNEAFKSANNRAPIIAERGEEAEAAWLALELKLVADVGIIGVPNSGKSTLLSVLSDAKPKIADYAFTTLVPNLGVCELDYQTTVFADVPGLIEGAHQGDGLGHEFLRHVSRARSLVHVIDGTGADALYDYRAIRLELQLFGMDLDKKPQLIAYNKIDVPESGDYVEDMKELLAEECGVPPEHVFPISAVTGQGVLDLVRAVRGMLENMPAEELRMETAARNQQIKTKSSIDSARLDDYVIEADLAEARTWFVEGVALTRFARMTNFDYFEATLRFQRVLQTIGLWGALEKRGVVDGDTVVIGETEFVWSSDRSEGSLYRSWAEGMEASGAPGKGSARWPHMSA